MRHEDLYVTGTGCALPPRMTAQDAVQRELAALAVVQKADIASVTVCDSPEAPPELAARAATVALDRAGTAPGDIGLILHAHVRHQGHQLWAPASYVQRRTLGNGCPAIEVRQASNGGMAALELAASRLCAHPQDGGALLTTGDIWPLPSVDRWRSDPGTVYADGGTALVLSATGGFARISSLVTVSDPELEGMHRIGPGSGPATVNPARPVDLDVARNEFLDEFGMSYSAARVRSGQRATIKAALAEADLDLPGIDWFVLPHFGRRRLSSVYFRPFGIDPERTTWSWGRTVGHLGAGDQFAGLDHLVSSGRLRAGQRCLLVGVGSGFTWSCAVVEMLETPSWATAPPQL
ncbi:ketoacyl-ACP synthase III family protein [Streptomyces rimosus]|uniref:ketoacyl-ACP synthase III family protein n=1 Tax=Streptomyces rimosus TaxID=1927 RepID=UPI0004C088B5|nr:ketoacyl-ACP synthase III family protein [Streptomyces rimosus]